MKIFYIVLVIVMLFGCKEEQVQPRIEESASGALTPQEVHKALFNMLDENEDEIVKILHKDTTFIREDFKISPSTKITWDRETRRWATQIGYGFFGYAEASCTESGGDQKIEITNTEKEVYVTQTLIPAKKRKSR